MNKTIMIIGLVFGVLALLLGIAYPFLKKLTEKTETKVDDIALDVTKSIVDFVDKNFGNMTGSNKKIRAVDLITMKLESYGIKGIDVSGLIERVITDKKIVEISKKEEISDVVGK